MEFPFTPTPKNRHWHWDFRDDVQGIQTTYAIGLTTTVYHSAKIHNIYTN